VFVIINVTWEQCSREQGSRETKCNFSPPVLPYLHNLNFSEARLVNLLIVPFGSSSLFVGIWKGQDDFQFLSLSYIIPNICKCLLFLSLLYVSFCSTPFRPCRWRKTAPLKSCFILNRLQMFHPRKYQC
jgi:hypothetical protein